MTLYAATIALSAFLLFLVQPLIARLILPWFGGSAAVWTTCMVFFQLALLAGYFYADRLVRLAAPRRQAQVHAVLLVASLAWLPVLPSAALAPADGSQPILRILLLLAATIGLPYLTLSTTGPLMQAWSSRSLPPQRVYRLYALSNAASLLALLAYPPLIEPNASSRWQALGWSAGYAVFVLLGLAAARRSAIAAGAPGPAAGSPVPAGSPAAPAADAALAPAPAPDGAGDTVDASAAPGTGAQLLWLTLSALGSVLLLAVTTHLTQNVASVPFLWIVPLVLYLTSFILCFDGRGWYWPRVYPAAAAVAALLMAGALEHRVAGGWRIERGLMHIEHALPLYSLGLFVLCMYLHGELVRRKPPAARLTRFYLMVSLGGAIGGVAVGIAAPLLFDWYWELPIAVGAAAALVALLQRGPSRWLGLASLAGCALLVSTYAQSIREDTIELSRSFYGTLRVKRTAPDSDDNAKWRLLHGVITHGEQYRAERFRRLATTYYGESSGVGQAIAGLRAVDGDGPQHVGLIGLGVGTLACYGRRGDRYRIYELNPAVIELARRRFSYLDDSAARIDTPLGDARLTLEREPPQGFDLLAIDAFSSDAIPVHLITREAVQHYARHLRPGGVIAFHISNRYLELAGVTRQLADAIGMQAIRVIDEPGEDSYLYRSDWVLITANAALVRKLRDQDKVAFDVAPSPKLPSWTDDHHDLFRVLK